MEVLTYVSCMDTAYVRETPYTKGLEVYYYPFKPTISDISRSPCLPPKISPQKYPTQGANG